MSQYRNETLGVVNVGGEVIAPKKTADVDDEARGLANLVKSGVLSKVDGRTKSSKTENKPAEKPAE